MYLYSQHDIRAMYCISTKISQLVYMQKILKKNTRCSEEKTGRSEEITETQIKHPFAFNTE